MKGRRVGIVSERLDSDDKRLQRLSKGLCAESNGPCTREEEASPFD
jgi:hypothetical protein